MPLFHLKTKVGEVIDQAQRHKDVGGVDHVGLPTGFTKIDKMTGGMRNGELVILGGRTGMGKSAAAMTIALNVAARGKTVLYSTLEMSAFMLSLRAVSTLTGIEGSRIERGALNDEEMRLVQSAEEQIANHRLALLDESLTSQELATQSEQFKEGHGLDLLIVDYLTLLRDQSDNEVERLTTISSNLVATAKKLDIPVLALVQLNRSTETRESNVPQLSDIRGSGAMEMDASFVMFVYREHYYNMKFDAAEPVPIENDAFLILDKNRHGESGRTRAQFHAERAWWSQPDTKPAEGKSMRRRA